MEPGRVNATWDWMHLLGLVDKKLCKKEEFLWMQSMTEVCHDLFTTFNWGANYELFRFLLI